MVVYKPSPLIYSRGWGYIGSWWLDCLRSMTRVEFMLWFRRNYWLGENEKRLNLLRTHNRGEGQNLSVHWIKKELKQSILIWAVKPKLEPKANQVHPFYLHRTVIQKSLLCRQSCSTHAFCVLAFFSQVVLYPHVHLYTYITFI